MVNDCERILFHHRVQLCGESFKWMVNAVAAVILICNADEG